MAKNKFTINYSAHYDATGLELMEALTPPNLSILYWQLEEIQIMLAPTVAKRVDTLYTATRLEKTVLDTFLNALGSKQIVMHALATRVFGMIARQNKYVNQMGEVDQKQLRNDRFILAGMVLVVFEEYMLEETRHIAEQLGDYGPDAMLDYDPATHWLRLEKRLAQKAKKEAEMRAERAEKMSQELQLRINSVGV